MIVSYFFWSFLMCILNAFICIAWVPIEFGRERQSQYLKRWFFLKNRPIHFHDLKFHKISVHEEDQNAKHWWKPWIYIKCYSSSSTSPLKSLAVLSDKTVRGSAVDLEDLKPDKIPHFSKWLTYLLFIIF